MISIISGTNRKGAVSYQMAKYYSSLLDKENKTNQIIDLEKSMPADFIATCLYENSRKNEAFNATIDLVNASDAIIFIIPEYNGSFPGVLKTFIDGLEYPKSLKNKKILLTGISSGHQGGALALSHFSDILCHLGAQPTGIRVKINHIENQFDGKAISNHLINDLIQEQISFI